MQVGSIYANTIKNHFKVFHANWLPSTPVKLGDYGQVIGGIFQRIGNITDFDEIAFETREDETEDHIEFSSSDDAELIFGLGGGAGDGNVGNARASLEIKFASENAVFFNAAGCKLRSIANIQALGESLIALDKQGSWKRSWSVVTSVLEAGATTIVVSGGRDSSIVLEAEADGIRRIDLANASLKFSRTSQRKVAFRVIAEEGLSPLIALMEVRRGPFNGPRKFERASLLMAADESSEAVFVLTEEFPAQ